MYKNFSPSCSTSKGFTLIELMVGLAVSLILTVIMYQMFANDELRNRRMTDVSAQTQNSGLALLMLERHIRNAGAGFATVDPASSSPLLNSALGCQLTTTAGTFSFAPINVRNGADGATTDSLDVMYGTGAKNTLPYAVDAVAGGGLTLTLKNTQGIAINDWVLVANAATAGSTCYIAKVTATALNAASNNTIYGSITIDSAVTAGVTTYQVFNLGPSPQLLRFALNSTGNALMQTNLLTNAVSVFADNVVNFQIQLGVDTNTDNVTDSWSEPPASIVPPATRGTTLAAGSIGFNQIKLLRVGIVTRNEVAEVPTGASCTTAGSTAPAVLPAQNAVGTVPAMPTSVAYTYSGKALCYRYRTSSMLMPIVNLINNNF